MSEPCKPSQIQILAAYGKTVPDLIRPGLAILFSGINPSLYSAAVGQHFARPGNRFWPALHSAEYTSRLFSPFEGRSLLDLGYGITNIVDHATSSADEISAEEFVEGGRRLESKVRLYHPAILAFLGITAYRAAFGRPRARIGLQAETIHETSLWVLPNPSGLNAHYRLADLAALYATLRIAGEQRTKGPSTLSQLP